MRGARREGFGAEHVGDAASAFWLWGRGNRRIFLEDGAVEEDDFAAGDGGDAVAGDQDAGEVEGVGGGYIYGELVGSGGVLGAGFAEGVDGFGEGILLAEGAGDEAATADLAAGFEATEDGEEIAPFGGVGLAGEELAEEHAVAAEEDAGVGVECSDGLFGRGDGAVAFSVSGAREILRTHP